MDAVFFVLSWNSLPAAVAEDSGWNAEFASGPSFCNAKAVAGFLREALSVQFVVGLFAGSAMSVASHAYGICVVW